MAETNENSVITKTRRIKTCKASSGALDSLPPVAYMAFGDGGCDDEGEPIQPTEDQTALVGQTINEAALVDSDGDAVAIKTMYPKRKDAGAAFTFTLDDEF